MFGLVSSVGCYLLLIILATIYNASAESTWIEDRTTHGKASHDNEINHHKSHAGWNYDNQHEWPGKCNVGKKQSPIDLNLDIAVKKEFSPFIFVNYDKHYGALMENNRHSVQVKLLPTNEYGMPSVHGGGLHDEYILDHLHFHWKSEHTINNYRFPLEIHLVHFATKYQNFSAALNYKNGVAVMGVLFSLSPDDDKIFTPFIEVVEKVQKHPNEIVALDYKLMYNDFLPRDTAGFYRYDGSLTTPNCNEGVLWTVFTNTIPISKSQVAQFEKIWADDNKPLLRNFRHIQDLNNRLVYIKISPLGSHASTYKKTTFISFVIPIITSILWKYVL